MIDTHVENGVVVRTKIADNQQRNITYCVSWGFEAYGAGTRARIQKAVADATSDWQKSADIRFSEQPVPTSGCTASNTSLVFNVVVDTTVPDGGAFAAFPDQTDRGLHVGCKATDAAGKTVCKFSKTPDDVRRLFLHEIGHLLGFRHEFLNKSAACSTLEPTDWEALTPYDSESALNYVSGNAGSCVGTAAVTFLTDSDRIGTQKVYGIPWEDMGGSTMDTPAVSSWGSGRLDVFVRGTDRQLQHRWYDGQWQSWEPLGGVITSPPAAVSWGPGRVDVVARGADGHLYTKWFDGGWHGWAPLEGSIGAGTPAITSWGPGRLDVFVRAIDNQLWHRKFEEVEGGWFPWEPLGNVLSSGVAATSWGVERMDVVARGADGQLWIRSYDHGWFPWAPLGVSPNGLGAFDPSISNRGPGSLDVWTLGASGGSLYQLSYAGGWRPWEKIGANITTGVGAVSWGAGRLDLFAGRGTPNLFHAWFSGNLWRSP